MRWFLRQFLSSRSLGELQEGRHFCHNTFRHSGKSGLLREAHVNRHNHRARETEPKGEPFVAPIMSNTTIRCLKTRETSGSQFSKLINWIAPSLLTPWVWYLRMVSHRLAICRAFTLSVADPDSHGMRNEVAPRLLEHCRSPHAQSGGGSWMHMMRERRPQLIFDLSLHFSIADMRTSFYHIWW